MVVKLLQTIIQYLQIMKLIYYWSNKPFIRSIIDTFHEFAKFVLLRANSLDLLSKFS